MSRQAKSQIPSLARPPIAQDRLTERPHGRLQYVMKRAWRDGTHALVFEPLARGAGCPREAGIARICAMIPPPPRGAGCPPQRESYGQVPRGALEPCQAPRRGRPDSHSTTGPARPAPASAALVPGRGAASPKALGMAAPLRLAARRVSLRPMRRADHLARARYRATADRPRPRTARPRCCDASSTDR